MSFSHSHTTTLICVAGAGAALGLCLAWRYRSQTLGTTPPDAALPASPSAGQPERPPVPASANSTSAPGGKEPAANVHLSLPEVLTVIVTTSPVQSNPSTELIRGTVGTFDRAPELYDCPKIFVCDGYITKAPDSTGRRSYRAGVITPEHVPKYVEFKARLRALIESAVPGSPFSASTLLELTERQGFGYAVKAALEHVTTPFVIVVQHDRTFMRPVRLPALVRVLHTEADIQMISLLTRSTMQHAHRVCGRIRSGKGAAVVGYRMTDSDWEEAKQPRVVHGQRLVRLLQWLDSTHLAKTDYYRNVVFAKLQCAKGGFIEDRFGNIMLDDLRAQGLGTHAQYGTWIYDDELMEPMVGHDCGRSFLTPDERTQRIRTCQEAMLS